MAPRVKKPVEKVPSKEPPGKGKSPRTAPGRRKINKSKTKGRKGKEKLKLKGWLATPADWTRFNAWAKINALPKKYPEPEPIVRPAKPLSELKRRIKLLAIPKIAPDPPPDCRLDHTIPKSALKVVPSKRTLILALPKIRLFDFGRVYYKVAPGALTYEPSERILALSQPRSAFLPEECKPPAGAGLSLCEKRGVDEDRLNQLALQKKLLACPEQLTPEEIEQLFTPQGVRRSALIYQVTPWVAFLALPKYTRLKGRKDKNAKMWKKQIIEEGEERGKSALAEHIEKEEARKRAKKRKCEDEEKDRGSGDDKKEAEQEGEEETEEDAKKAKRRKMEKHAWRFAPSPHKDDPYRIPKGALTAKESPRTAELAKPRVHESKVIRTDAFTVKKGALTATASGRVEALAKPSRPRSPIEKKPPREKDEFGRPIYEMPAYGKVLPKTKPYKMGECPTEEKKKVVEKRPIDPIAYERSIDPCIYPDLARRQKCERKRAAKLARKKKGRDKRRSRRKRLKDSKADGKAEQEKEEEKVEETDAAVDETEAEAEGKVEGEVEVKVEVEGEGEGEVE
ncbi:hypothetical protein ANTPLA_LOCUS7279 [Anthophora plagiata]